MTRGVAVGSALPVLARAGVRRLTVAAFAVAATVTCALVVRSRPDDQLADLRVYWGAVRWVERGLPLYEFKAANGDPFTYPPFAELVLAPVGRLPFAVAGAAWTLVSLWAIVVLGRLVTGRALQVPVEQRAAAAWLVSLAVLVSGPGQSNIHFGQVSLLLVLACLADGLGVTDERSRGVLTGLAAAVKLTPLLFIAHLLVSGQRRTAAHAGASFAAATTLAWLLRPSDSRRFWTSAVFSTGRIGDITALGNQSVNGALLRAGLPPSLTSALWVTLAGLVVTSALWRARRLHLAGQAGRAVVLVGCATIAASPVSWTHHQFWTLLAGILLLATTGTARRIAGILVVLLMTVNLGNVVAAAGPPTRGAGYLADNLRALAACLVCTTALLAATEPRRAAQTGGTRVRGLHVPGRRIAVGLAATFVVFLVLPVPTRGSLDVAPAAPGVAARDDAVSEGPCEPALSCRVGGPLGPVNYGVGWGPDGVTVLGLASESVTRIDYVPAPGRRPVTIRLDATGQGDQAFEFTTGDTTYGQLLVYGPHQQLLGEHGAKLRHG